MEINTLLGKVRSLVISARKAAVKNINSIQVFANFGIGRLIVEHEQTGKKRAEYGKNVLCELSARLEKEFGRGFSEDNLSNMRKFYLIYKNRLPEISETPSRKSSKKTELSLSWSHYVFLCKIVNENERRFYEIESNTNNWSLHELKRQFDSSLYERLALSRNKGNVKALAEKGQTIKKPQDMLKSPYVLEFLGLDEKAVYSESDLKSAIIDKIEHFLLELGKGFLFEARQKRFTFDEDHFFVDLVFYNRLLHCYVLVDLKIGRLTHQNIGQMQMYVNYFDRFVRTKDEKPTIGIILCKKKHDVLVEITLPKDSNIHAAEYQLYLPSKEELKSKLMEWNENE